MNRDPLQQLTRERIVDAQALLDGGRWSSAYYTAGYAVECALKACFLTRIPITRWVFQDKVRIDDCRVHDFGTLDNLAGLTVELNNHAAITAAAGRPFGNNWKLVQQRRMDDPYS